MTIINYQFYIYPSPLWLYEHPEIPDMIIRTKNLLLYGYLSLIILGALSNTAAMLFSWSIMSQCSTSVIFFILAIIDHFSVFCNMLPKYLEISRIKKFQEGKENGDFLQSSYMNLLAMTPELQSSFNCKILEFTQNSFRSVSAWLIVAMTYFRLMSIMYPIEYRSRTVAFYLVRSALVLVIIPILHSFPLFTKRIFSIDMGSLTLKLCHHDNILGIEFYHFEKIFTATVFPVLPCLLIIVFNIALIVQYKISTKTSTQSEGKILLLYFSARNSVSGRSFHEACSNTAPCLSYFVEQSKKDRQLIISVVGVSVSFICLCSPFVWNVLRQLSMKYNSKVVNDARRSGSGEVFNYEYHIVVFILSINNCINFYIYLLSSSTWRKIFKDSITAKWRKWACCAK